MILSLMEAWSMVLHPVDVRCGQSARDDIIDVSKPALYKCCLEDWACRQTVGM